MPGGTLASTVTHANWAAVDSPEFHAAFERALARQLAQADESHDLLIGGKDRPGLRYAPHVSPGDARVRLGRVAVAGAADVARAVDVAHAGFPSWRATPVEQRVSLLRRVGEVIESRCSELAALLSVEIAKNRYEATTEVHEAIELVRFYCDAIEAQHGFVTEFPPLGDELSVSVMRPYGVWAILGPFNFPFALVAGMATAALLTGNTVVIKPPDLAPVASRRFAELCLEAGLPAEVVHVVMGGADTGRALTGHPRVEGVGFTGSMKVGQAIRRALDGKPVVAEMGGKNPAIVTASADLELAAEAICRSAFRYAGQKCSACSRVYVAEHLADALADAIHARAGHLRVGVPWEAGTTVGPLISARSKERFDAAVAAAVSNARRTMVTDLPAGLPDGAYTRFAIAFDLPNDHELLRCELFAPLLCVQPVGGFEEALQLANDVPFGLTAGLYTRDQREIDAFLEQIEAGVVYVNRASGATTGAWVGHQSFGGWKGSGSTGANAHGSHYLQQFAREQSRTVAGA